MDEKKLTLEELTYVQDEVAQKGKSSTKAYVLGLFLGPLGIHRSYLNKRKSGALRLSLTTLSLIALPATSFFLQPRSPRGFLIHNAILAVGIIGSAAANLAWTFYDLFQTSKWIDEIDKENESIATEKIIQARYVSEHLLKDQLSAELIEQAKKEATEIVLSELNVLIKENKEEKSTQIPKLSDTITTEKPFEMIVKEDIEYVEDNKDYPEHESQISIEILMPDEIEEEYKSPISEITGDLDGLVKPDTLPNIDVLPEIYNEKSIDIINDEIETELTEGFQVDSSKPENAGYINSENSSNVKDTVDTKEVEALKVTIEVDKDNKVINEKTNAENDTNKSSKMETDLNMDNIEAYSVDEAILNNEGIHLVKGYIVGKVSQSTQTLVKDNFTNDINILIADSVEETNESKMLAIQLPKDSEFRNSIGLKSQPDNIGKQILIKGSLEKYFGRPGIKNPEEIIILS